MSEMTFGAAATSSNMCGVTLMNNQNGYVVAEVMGRKEDVIIEEFPSMIRVNSPNVLTFDFDEITEELGEEFNESDFEEMISTHYGRMVHFDDRMMLFANPEDAAEYIDFDLPIVE